MPQLSGIQVALRQSPGQELENNAIIFFDSPINQIGTGITYSKDTLTEKYTGIFTISQSGHYRVDWWATIDGTAATVGIMLALNVGDSVGERVHSRAAAPPVTSQVSGSALVTVDDAPVNLFITNISEKLITFEDEIDVQANIVIVELPS